jgi:16S rRNA (cytosine967-C5)-methyltransferase
LGFDETESLLEAFNERPLLNLKVIQSAIDTDRAIKMLRDEGITAERGRHLPDFIKCNDAGAVLNSDVFSDGMLNVQDESQGIAAHLLNPPRGSTVLDLCSAPGGKSIALADMVGANGKVISLDNDPERLKQLEKNMKRTGVENIEVLDCDIFEFATVENFKYILLDVPCSGLGTIGSNVDLRWRKTERDIRQLAPLQKKMLAKASTLLDDGGRLVYSTCTTEREEIEEVIESFLKANPGFELEDGNSSFLEPFKSDIGIYRSWPHKLGTGGGGFARLKKNR